MAELKELAETLVNLTIKEVSELAQILKDEYGIEPAAAAPVAMAVAGGGGDAGGDAKQERSLYSDTNLFEKVRAAPSGAVDVAIAMDADGACNGKRQWRRSRRPLHRLTLKSFRPFPSSKWKMLLAKRLPQLRLPAPSKKPFQRAWRRKWYEWIWGHLLVGDRAASCDCDCCRRRNSCG